MIAQVALPYGYLQIYDYDASAFGNIAVGVRVVVNFAGRRIMGYVVKLKPCNKNNDFRLKPILLVLDTQPTFSLPSIELAVKVSEYYFCGIGTVLEMMLPPAMRQTIRFDEAIKDGSASDLPQEMIYVREAVSSARRFSLYAAKIRDAVHKGYQAIVSVADTEDVSFVFERLNELLDGVRIVHVPLTKSKKDQLKIWLDMRCGRSDVLVGTRTSVLVPVHRLGLLIVDIENAYGHCHGMTPFFNTRDVALMRAKQVKASLILHSDLPSLEVNHYISKNRFSVMDLHVKTAAEAVVYDLNNYNFKKYPVFSDLCTGIINSYLEKNKRIIIFWNRKGFSTLMRCTCCKELLKCGHCDSFLRFDKHNNNFVCGLCQRKKVYSPKCPSCSRPALAPLGVGLERIEENLNKFFPDKKIFSISSQSAQIPSVWDILVTTQKLLESCKNISADLVIASGLDSQVALGGYHGAYDAFVILQRLFRLADEKIIFFTLNPDYYPFASLKKGAEWFYKKEMHQRKLFELPPYCTVVDLVLRCRTEQGLDKKILELKRTIESNLSADRSCVSIFGPLKEDHYRYRGQYHQKIIIKSADRQELNKVLRISLAKFKRGSVKLSLFINQ